MVRKGIKNHCQRFVESLEVLIVRDRLVRPIFMSNACKAGIWIALFTLCPAGEIAGCIEYKIDGEART